MSPALWHRYSDTAPDAYDDAAGFERTTIFGREDSLAGVPLRVDCGEGDPFHPASRDFVRGLVPRPAGGFSRGARHRVLAAGGAEAAVVPGRGTQRLGRGDQPAGTVRTREERQRRASKPPGMLPELPAPLRSHTRRSSERAATRGLARWSGSAVGLRFPASRRSRSDRHETTATDLENPLETRRKSHIEVSFEWLFD
jgi:hypothetical protein